MRVYEISRTNCCGALPNEISLKNNTHNIATYTSPQFFLRYNQTGKLIKQLQIAHCTLSI